MLVVRAQVGRGPRPGPECEAPARACDESQLWSWSMLLPVVAIVLDWGHGMQRQPVPNRLCLGQWQMGTLAAGSIITTVESALSACEPEESGTVRRQTVFTHSPTFCTRLCGQCCFMPVRKSSKNCAAFVPVCGRPAASIWAVVAVHACRALTGGKKIVPRSLLHSHEHFGTAQKLFSFQPLARGNGRAPVRGSHDFYHTV